MNESPKTHTAVVGIPNAEDPVSIAATAAHAALSLLTRVSARERGSVSIKTVSITEPEHLDSMDAFWSAIRQGGSPSKAVVVVAEVSTPPADEEAKPS